MKDDGIRVRAMFIAFDHCTTVQVHCARHKGRSFIVAWKAFNTFKVLGESVSLG